MCELPREKNYSIKSNSEIFFANSFGQMPCSTLPSLVFLFVEKEERRETGRGKK